MRIASDITVNANSDLIRSVILCERGEATQLLEELRVTARFSGSTCRARVASISHQTIFDTGKALALSCGHGGGPGEDGGAQKPRLPAKSRHCATRCDIDAGV